LTLSNIPPHSSLKRLLALFIGLWVAAGAACAQPDPLFTQIDGIVAELSAITGLAKLHKIDYDHIAKDQVARFMEQTIEDTARPEEIRAEELALKKFGFVPADFDLKKTMLALLTEQAAAFYDYRKKKLFVLDSTSDPLQGLALVHELAHALADQHFHLQKFVEGANRKDDSELARMAVMEGQATWLMFEQPMRKYGQSLKDSPELVALMSRAPEMAGGQFPVFEHAPLYIRESLLFPYTQGMLFQQALVQKLGQAAFTEVFRHPPVSTQQILHPEKYFAGVLPVVPPLPRWENRRHWRNLSEGAIGEFDHAVLLRQYAGEPESARIAPQGQGAYYRLLENKDDGRLVLLYSSDWASAAAARDFYALYQRVLKGKWKAFRADSQTGDSVAGQGDDGYFLLRLDGTRVTSVEGMNSPGEATAAPANTIH
jgi:hypothetical protein